MKKIILSVAAVFAFGFANAQETSEGNGFTKGDIFMTGSVGFNSSKTGDFTTSTFEVAPSIGFFVNENIAVGLRVGVGNEKLDFDGEDVTNNMFSVGAFGRYYWTPANQFSFFGELGFTYNTTNNEFVVFEGELMPADYKTTGFEIAVRPGVSYFISSNFALEATIGSLGYATTKPDYDGAESTNDFGLNVDFTDVTIGVVYKF
jgi:hypothetical protein